MLFRSPKARLLICSWERIRNEFFLILNQPGASSALTLLDSLELLSILLPEIDGMRGMDQGSHHTYTLFEHALRTVECMEMILLDPERFFPRHSDVLHTFFVHTVEGAIPGRTLAMFMALLHDIGKPATCQNHDGETHFYGHEQVGMKIARRIAARFKLSKKTGMILSKTIQHHMRPLQLQLLQRVTDRARYRLIRDMESAALYTLILAFADAMATREVDAADPKSIPLYPLIADLLDYYCSGRPDKGEIALLSGHEIMEALQLKPGKKVGVIIEAIREAERQGHISTKEEALQLIAEKHMRD